MIVNLNWEDFHTRFYLENTIFVKENSNTFEFITNIDGLIIRSLKDKHVNPEEDIIFIERYITDKKNIVKALNFDGVEEIEEEEIEEEEIEEEDFE